MKVIIIIIKSMYCVHSTQKQCDYKIFIIIQRPHSIMPSQSSPESPTYIFVHVIVYLVEIYSYDSVKRMTVTI